MNIITLTAIMIYIAAPPMNLFPLLYSRSPWASSLVGRSLMTSSVGLALLIDLSLMIRVFGPDYYGHDVIVLVAFAIMILGSYMQFFSLLKARRHHHPDIEHVR